MVTDQLFSLCRRQFQALSEKLVLTDLETSTKMEVCSRLWKYGHYPVIETFRRMGGVCVCVCTVALCKTRCGWYAAL